MQALPVGRDLCGRPGAGRARIGSASGPGSDRMMIRRPRHWLSTMADAGLSLQEMSPYPPYPTLGRAVTCKRRGKVSAVELRPTIDTYCTHAPRTIHYLSASRSGHAAAAENLGLPHHSARRTWSLCSQANLRDMGTMRTQDSPEWHVNGRGDLTISADGFYHPTLLSLPNKLRSSRWSPRHGFDYCDPRVTRRDFVEHVMTTVGCLHFSWGQVWSMPKIKGNMVRRFPFQNEWRVSS